MKGDPKFAKQIATAVLNDGIDVAYSYEQREGIHFPHAFGNTQIFLDYDNVGKEFPYPVIPLAVNCYGEHVIARKGGIARFADIKAGRISILRDRPRYAVSSSARPSVVPHVPATSASR